MGGAGQVDVQPGQVRPLAIGDRPPDGAGAKGARWQVERHLTERPAGLRPAPDERGDLPCHLDVTEVHRGAAPRRTAQFRGDLDRGDLPRGRGIPGIRRLHQGHPVGQVEPGDQVHLALVRVDGTGMHQYVGGGLVHRPDEPPGRRFHDLYRAPPGPAQPGARSAATARPADDRTPAAQHPAPDEGVGHRCGLRPEQCQVSVGQRQFRRRRAQVRGQHVRVAGIKHGRFHRAAQQRLGMMHQVGVQRVVAGDQHGDRTAPVPARPARLLPERCPRPRPACDEHGVQAVDVNAKLQGRGGGEAGEGSRAQRLFQPAPVLGEVAGAVGGHPLAEPGGARLGQRAPCAHGDRLGAAP